MTPGSAAASTKSSEASSARPTVLGHSHVLRPRALIEDRDAIHPTIMSRPR
jgi:hypothetical protein